MLAPLSTAAATALLHTLIPDHWLPFVLIGRARRWPPRRVAIVSGLSALIHVVLSVLLGLLAIGIGQVAAEAAGETLERIAIVLLVLFGLGYAAWAWRKGAHFHPGGHRLHAADAPGCPGREGDANLEHLHYHADESLIRSGPGWSGVGLAVLVGANPCVLVLPLLLTTASRGPAAISLVALAYAVPTVLLMVGLSTLGVATNRRIPFPWPARYAEMGSGLLVAGLGLIYFLFEG
jgi:ABC-type nickel/cobalt efflux system permease component RcnA